MPNVELRGARESVSEGAPDVRASRLIGLLGMTTEGTEMTEEQLKRKKQHYMLHVLRNPFGWSDEVVREMRLLAADELERLYRVEDAARQAAEDFSRAVPNA